MKIENKFIVLAIALSTILLPIAIGTAAYAQPSAPGTSSVSGTNIYWVIDTRGGGGVAIIRANSTQDAITQINQAIQLSSPTPSATTSALSSATTSQITKGVDAINSLKTTATTSGIATKSNISLNGCVSIFWFQVCEQVAR